MIELARVPFYFIRHGETDWNVQGRPMGWSDIVLNENGEKQSFFAKQFLSDRGIKTICYSPLKRAARTASIINEDLNCAMVEIEELKECGWGPYEGIERSAGMPMNEWLSGKEIPGVESRNDFVARLHKGINKALAEQGPVLIVAHSGTYRFLQMAFAIALPQRIGNAIPCFIQPFPAGSDGWSISLLG